MLPLLDSLISSLFPHRCRVCDGKVDSIYLGSACSSCWNETRIYTGDEALCPKCGNFLREGRIACTGRCHRCDNHDYDRAIACGTYEKALSATVVELKIKPFMSGMARDLALCRFGNAALDNFDVLVPVPLSARRRKERGFNQAELIGGALSRGFGIKLDTESLIRTVNTPIHRAGMDDKARDMTVRKAFEVNDRRAVEGRSIVLVDDVMTSGATAAHCAAELKKNGAAKVNVFTLARAL